LRRDHVLALSGMSDDVKLGMQRNGSFDEMPLTRGIGDRAGRTFGVIERLISSAGLIENGSRLHTCFFRPYENDAEVIAEVKRNPVAALGDSGPAALRPRSRLRSAFAVGVSFYHGAGPVLVHVPLIIDTTLRGEVADDRYFDLGGSFKLHET